MPKEPARQFGGFLVQGVQWRQIAPQVVRQGSVSPQATNCWSVTDFSSGLIRRNRHPNVSRETRRYTHRLGEVRTLFAGVSASYAFPEPATESPQVVGAFRIGILRNRSCNSAGGCSPVSGVWNWMNPDPF